MTVSRIDLFKQMFESDIELLIKLLGIKSAEEVLSILVKYYPYQQIKPATQYFIEELFK